MDSISALDSNILGGLHTTEELRSVLGERGLLERFLRVEASVASVQAELGLIPTEAADAIAAVTVASLDVEAIAVRTTEVGYPIVGLVEQLSEVIPDGLGQYAHWGLTTQDVMDTALVLQISTSLDAIEDDVVALARALSQLAVTHRDTPMIGRSQGQHALPITFGHRVSAWLDPILRHLERLDQLRPRVEVIQLGGAVGTLASLMPLGLEVRNGTAARLGLGVPVTSWHATRDRLVEVVMWTAQLAASLAKIGLDVTLGAQTEVAELREAAGAGRGVSSTMPHKRNPIGAQQLIRAGRLTRSYVDLTLDGAIADHDRATASWSLEWHAIAPSLAVCGGAAQAAAQVVSGLEVDSEAMAVNLETTGGLIMAEAVMMHLAPEMGRQRAHDVVQTIVRRSLGSDTNFRSLVVDEFPNAASALDAASYLGHAQEQIDATAAYAERVLANRASGSSRHSNNPARG